jgi:uncharacterized membrane protein YedE/YeeE
MKTKLLGLLFGAAIGFVFAWAWLSDPAVIRDMLLLREPDVFLLMGSAIAVAVIGTRLLRLVGARALVGNEPVAWTIERPEQRHVVGSVLFGAGWAVARTCPGPVAVMIGEGRLGGLVVAIGLGAGVLLQGALKRRRLAAATGQEAPGMAGL